MNSRWLIGIGAVTVLLVIWGRNWWPGKPGPPEPPSDLPPPVPAGVSGRDGTGAVPLATAPPAGPNIPPITAPDPVVLALAERGQPDQPWTWARVAEVPPLDPVTQAELIRRCRALASPADQMPLIHLLSLGGDGEAVDFLIEFVTQAYAGKVLSVRDNYSLSREGLRRLGIAARRILEAVRFLEAACQPEFWTEANLWKSADYELREVRRIMVTHSIEGLAWSESPVADQLLEAFRQDPNRAAELGIGGGVMMGAFTLSYLREHGLDKAVDAWLLADLDRRMDVYEAWRGSEEAREWCRWGAEVLAIETRRAQEREKSRRSP